MTIHHIATFVADTQLLTQPNAALNRILEILGDISRNDEPGPCTL